jgi:hypothetical protein
MKHCLKMQIKYVLGVFLIFAFSILFAGWRITFVTNAQGLPSAAGSGIDLTASTDNPVPGQNVTITARSYSIDINSAKVSWSVNGTTKQSAIGATTLVVQAPTLGKKIGVVVTATTPTGSTVSGSITLGSGSVDMIMETDGYVPPFFLGKIAPVYQNSVKVVAIPHLADNSGKEFDPKTLVYQWRKNSEVMEDYSGYGKQSITLKGDIVPRPYSLTVTASTRDNSAQAVGTISVTPQSPSIAFYVNDPLYGTLFNTAISDTLRIGSQKETGVLAVPFGFNENDKQNELSMTWMINDMEHPELANNPSIILRAPSDAGGSSNIQLNIANSSDILQGGNAGFTAAFSANSQSNQTNPATL